MSLHQDYRRRRSFSYKMKRWFFLNHRKEVKIMMRVVGDFLLAITFFGMIFFLPHLFH